MAEARNAQLTRTCGFCGGQMRPFDRGTYCSNHTGKKFTDWLRTRHRGSATSVPSDLSAPPGEIYAPPTHAVTTKKSNYSAVKTDLPIAIPPTVTVDPQRIINAVVDTCTVTHQSLAGPGSSRHVAQPRMLAMYLIRRYCTSLTPTDVGARFNRDPGAVGIAVVTVKEALRNRVPWAMRPIRHIEEQLSIPREQRSL